MNCSFVASEVGEHPLQLIGDWLGLSREGVRLIEKKALGKLRKMNDLERDSYEPLREPIHLAGQSSINPSYQRLEPNDQVDLFSTFYGGKLDE